MSECAEVPLVERLRSVSKDHRACIAEHWDASGREIGHRLIPVGVMMHEAADRIALLASQLSQAREALEKLARLGNGDEYGNSIGNEIARAALAAMKGEA